MIVIPRIAFFNRFFLPIFLAALCGFASEVLATPWNELAAGSLMKLREPLRLEEGFQFPKGSSFALKQIRSLDPIRVEELSLRHFPCPPDWLDRRAALQIIEERYGLEMSANCEITLFIETRDLFEESLFEVERP